MDDAILKGPLHSPSPIVYANGADRQSGMQLPLTNLSKFKMTSLVYSYFTVIFFLADNRVATFQTI